MSNPQTITSDANSPSLDEDSLMKGSITKIEKQ